MVDATHLQVLTPRFRGLGFVDLGDEAPHHLDARITDVAGKTHPVKFRDRPFKIGDDRTDVLGVRLLKEPAAISLPMAVSQLAMISSRADSSQR